MNFGYLETPNDWRPSPERSTRETVETTKTNYDLLIATIRLINFYPS